MLAAAAILPAALSMRDAQACSLAVPSPTETAQRIPKIQALFDNWFRREELPFLAQFYWSVQNRDPDEQTLRAFARAAEDQEPNRLYAELFTDPETYKTVNAITVVDEEAFVSVTEQLPGGIGPDCSGMPTQHLFLVGFGFGRPAMRLRRIQSKTFTGFGHVSHWSYR